MEDPVKLLKRYDRLKNDRQLWEPVWQDIADYIHPRRSNITIKRSPGSKQTEKLFDSTALDAHDRLAATLNGTLTSRAAKWFGLKMRDEKLNESTPVKNWLEDCSKRMFEAFNQSNFGQEVHEVYLDESAFGTSGMFVEERDPQSKTFQGFIFRTLELQSFVIDEDVEGRVNTVFRCFDLSATNAQIKFGDQAGEKVLRSIADGKGDKIYSYVHAIVPRDGATQDPKPTTPKLKLPWASVYISVADKTTAQEGGFHEFPVMVPRWSKSAGEKYGRGPGHLALPDVKTLNKAKELGLRTWAKTLDMPTMSLDDGVIGPIRNQPGGNTVVRDMDGLKPLYPAGYFRESLGNDQLKSDDLKASIRRIFYADQMELPTGPAMTAFEVAKRWELLTRMIGTTIGRQETELLNPLIDRTFAIMLRHDALPPPPPELTSGGKIDVVFEGPLAKSQRLSEVEGMERLNTLLVSMAQLQPEVLDNQDFDEAYRDAADVLGVPSRVVRDKDDVAKLRAQRQQQQAQQQQKNDMAQLAEGAGKAAPALKLLTQNSSIQNSMPKPGVQ